MTKLTATDYVYPFERNRDWYSLSGDLPVRMTNDYLFHALLQSDNQTLVSLVASLMGWNEKKIRSAEVMNPILLASSIEGKSFVLDVRVLMNDNANLNLEMQVYNAHNWTDRSLGYLCRLFDSLNKGDSYEVVRPAVQFSFLDFTLFDRYPEFFASYKIMNIRKPYAYTDKFQLHVIDLTRIHLATDHDKEYHLDLWAKMFKAKTWEDLKMLAKESDAIDDAVSVMHEMIKDEVIREQCRQREELYLYQEMEKRRLHRAQDDLKKVIKELETTKEALDTTKEERDIAKEERDVAKEKLDIAMEEIKNKDSRIEELEQKLRMLNV